MIIPVAFYVVQWQTSILVKPWIIVPSSLAVTLGPYELLVRRIEPVWALFEKITRP